MNGLSLQVFQYSAGEYEIYDEGSYTSDYLAEFYFKFLGYMSFSEQNQNLAKAQNQFSTAQV